MRLHVEGAFYVIFTVLFGIPALWAVSEHAAGVGVALGGVYVAIMLGLRAFEIVLDAGHLEFHSPLGKHERIAYSEIEVLRHFHDSRRGFRLEVVPKMESGREPFAINSKVFSRRDLETVFHTVRPFADVEDTVFRRAKAGVKASEPRSAKLDAIHWLMIFVLVGAVPLYFLVAPARRPGIARTELGIFFCLAVIGTLWRKRRGLPTRE